MTACSLPVALDVFIGAAGPMPPGKNGAFLASAKEDIVDEPLFIVGTHHKTGTALMALVLR